MADTTTPISLLRIHDVIARVGLSQPTIYRRIKTGEFPPGITLGCMRAWPSNDIDKWIDEQIARSAEAVA